MCAAQIRRAVAAAALVVLSAFSAGAQEDAEDTGPHPITPATSTEPGRHPKLVWRWERFRISEYFVTGASAMVSVGMLAVPPSPGRWRGGILVDEDVRSGIALSNYDDRRAARDVSDVLLASSIAYPVLVDGVILTSAIYDSDDVMEQMLLIDVEVLAITSAVQSVVAGFASRERPYGRVCGDDLPDESRDCRRNSRHRSFFSGHSSIAFAAAGLSCSHHMNLRLYGGGAADAAACGASLVVAATTGTLRMVGDVHYASDVAVGAVWGSLAGFGLPWLLHYKDPIDRRPKARSDLRLHLVPIGMGAGLGGTF
jgi:hypothetical protein